MKKLFVIAFLTLFALGAQAQQHRPHGKECREPRVEEMVSDLSPLQKRKLEALSKESREVVNRLRAQKHRVCDSIRLYHEKDGDQSKTLYRLYERDGMLQAEISKEMYRTRLRIDEILTPEQLKTFRAKLKASFDEKKKHPGSPHRKPGKFDKPGVKDPGPHKAAR